MGKSTLERYLEKKKLKEEEEKKRDKTTSKIPLPSLSEARLSVSADKLHIPESMREKSDHFSVSSTEKGTLERYRTKKSSQEVTAKLKTWYDEYSSYVSDYQSRTAGLTGTYNDSYSSGTSEWLADLTTRKNRLDKEADEIRGLLETTREVYGDKWTDAALVGLDMGRKTQEEILGGASSYNKYWSQWESEDKYNEWATYMRDREEKLSYDLEAGAREIALLENRLATVPLVKRPFSPIYEELNSKKAYYNLAEQLQSYESLKEQAISSPHFKSYAALGESDPRNINTTKGVKDDKYAGRYQGVAQFAANEDWLDHMTDEQREIYNYHVFADSQNGTNNAEKFLDLVEKGAQSAMYNKAYEKFDDSALGAVFYNAAANVVSAFTGIEAFLSEDGSARHSGLAESIAVASENESLKDIDLKYYNIIDKEWKDTDILGKSLGQVASEGVGTVAHMLPSVLASSLASFIGGPTVGRAVGSGMIGLSAAGAGKQQMLDLGYSKEQATAYGALVGASETLLEYAFSGISAIGGKAWDALGKTKLISKLDNVLGNISVKAPSALVALGKTVGGMAGEAFEEGLQTIIEPWLESVVLGGDYEAPDWEEVAYSSLLGALSAAGLEGIGASVNVRQTAKTGREIQNIEGGIQKLVDTGHSYSVDTVAHKLAGKIEAAINEGKKVNAYSIGKLFIEEGATLSEQNKNDIKRGLAEMNWDENSANIMTETYARFLDESIELSQEAIDIFTENAPFTRAVVNKLIGENTTAYQRQKGYVDLERMVNGETSVKASQEEETAPRTNNAPYAENPTEAAIKRVKADIEGDRNLLSADRSRKIAAEANKASSEDLARNALKVEGKYTSRGAGVTRLKNTHEKVSITDVVSTKDGNVRVRLNNNKVVDLAELDLASESDAVLYEAVAKMGVDAGAAKLIVNGYDSGSGVSAEAYALGMAEAINNGKYNIKQISNDGFAAMLNPIQQKLGRDIGRMGAEASARAEQDEINARVAKAKAEGKAKQVGGISYDASVDTESLTDTQKTQISVLEKVMPSLGVKVKFFASSVANESGKRGFTTEDGQFTRSNGWYDPETGDIWVDVNAGADGKGLILVTAAHELTHFIRQWSPAKYKIFADFIISQYGEGSKTVNELVKERQDVAVERGYTLSYDEALEEVVARSCESFLQDSDAAVKIAALAQKDKSLAQKIKSFVGQLLAKIRRIAKELGLAPDSEEGKYIASMETGLQSLYDMWTDALIDAGRSFSRAGVAVDGNTESASPMFSERTWSTSEYVTERDAAARKLAESLGVSIAKAKRYIDNVNSIAKIIANDRVRLDYEASSFGSAFVSNVEYGGSFDYTTLCKKRRIYTGTFQEIQKRIGDEVLSPDDILEIRNMMIEGGIEATCGLCYVEGSRANMGKFAKEFIKLYKRDNPDGWTPTMVDVNTPDGVEQMRINHPEAYDQYQYFWDHYGKLKDSDKALFASQQKPKLYEARKEYKGEILQHFKNVDTIAKKNRNGGIRMQSFSDFEIVHLIDTMQVIMDMSQVGLAGQAYTKVPEFAEAFGNTGLKINLSLIAKDVDANGNLVFDNREGMPAETAFRLRDKYSANVGTIIVTFTDEQLQAAMADPRIDFIIPFHRSQWKKSQYGAMGLPKGTKDYTYMQNEKLIKPTYHEFRGRMVKDKASNYMPNEYWDFSKTGKENAEAYLEMCAAENKRPKFYKLLDYDGNGKYSLKKDGSTDGYWKLLIDFKMYDNDGVGSPQMPVAPDFSMDEAMTMLDEYKGGHQSYPIAHGVVDKFIENYKASNRRQFSEREDNVTEREILADTLMGAAANDIEKNKLKAYKAKVKEMEAEQEKLGKIKAQIKELSFAKGKRDTEKIKRLRELAVKTENRINIYDRQLLSLEATKPMRDLLERRVAEVGAREKAKATEKAKAQLSAVREQRDLKLAQQKAAFYDQKMRAAERHDKTSMRNKIRERVDSLNKLLLNPTKEKHIPMNLQKPVAELLSIINMESSDNEKVKAKLQVLKAEYEAIAKSEDPVVAAGYHPEVAERIGNVAEVVGDTALKDMNLEQLDYLYETLTIVENVVRNANKGFKIAKGKTITDYGLNVMQEVLEVGGKDHMSNDTLDAISRFKWANLKPVYAFERIGSNTFTELFNNVRAGEDTWATDVSEARAFFLEKAKKYKYFDWDLEKTQEFSGKFGKKFELTLPQMMSLYAYSKRKQADLHLEDGGFVFEKAVKVKKKKHGVPIEYTVKVADPFSLRKEHLAVIVASLTDEQRAFVDEMQTYLSSVMGAKGNEVAREMYGIDLFKETDYFPLKSSSYYLAYNPEKDAQSKVKNYGMAKETVKNANNPIILSDFMDVWGKHVDEMSMYHAFVLPMEDFSKVFNFNTPTKDDGGNKASVQSRLTNAYGDEAVQYIKNLLTDLNGGARSDPNLGIISRLVGMFKKAKVFLSASVVIQQPSSIGRAFAVINPKYFTPNIKQKHGDAWNELKKYAPIATIKEMGYFDTNVGQSTVDYITGRDYNTLTEKIKGIATDKNYRDEAMGKLPAIADEMAWLQIWNAAKNEIADTTDLERGTEEFLNAAGKRFTEAVVKTQVYDSVLSRSAFMRSKDGLSKMLTSFLAEPTTTANMMSNALLQASRGNKKHFAATLGAVMTSIIMNSMLVSLVYAARDDDEDEAFTEKYVESLVTELIEGVNPATYLPIVKDIWSLLQEYDVERNDMSLISDLIDAIYGMLDDNKDWEEKIERLAVTLADMSGVPLNNVVKDIRAAFRFGSALFDDIKPTDIGMEGAIKDAVIDSVPFLDKFIKSASKSDKLYKAITSGSEEDLERAESAYKTDTSLETAIKKGLRENDLRVKKAAFALYSGDTRGFGEYVKAIAAEGNFDSETVEAAIRAEASAYKTKIEGAAVALEDGDQEAYKDLIRELRKAYKGILSQDEIVKAISEYEKPTEEAEDGFEEVESIYKTSDINTALESGDTDHALEIVKEILEVKVENNLAKARLEAEKSGKRFVEKKALNEAQTAANASVRSSLTSYWKKRYLEAFEAKDYAETERIRRLLHSTGVYGKLSELDADLKEWRKNN